MDYVKYLNGPLSVFAAGAAGSLVRVVLAPPSSHRLMIAHVLSGTLMALFVAPAVVEYWMRGNSIAMQRGVALVIGVAGPIAAEIVIRVIQRRGDQVADRLVNRVTGTEQEK